jgi:diguanylate cyclase (GGDEF)-like protein
MPNMDGLSLVKEVRKLYSDDQLAIIAFTASQGKYTADFLKMGANDFLNKPFSREELTCRIDRSLDLLFMVEQLRDSAERDVLTGLHNRRYFLKHAEKLFKEDRMQGLAILDIDFFKKINDCYGHEAGDEALRSIADTMREFMQPHLLVARLGGEEFCIVFTDQFTGDPKEHLENLRLAVGQKEITFINSNFYQTVSIGLVVNCKDHLSLTDIMMLADNRLYKAKHQGRNQVVDTD